MKREKNDRYYLFRFCCASIYWSYDFHCIYSSSDEDDAWQRWWWWWWRRRCGHGIQWCGAIVKTIISYRRYNNSYTEPTRCWYRQTSQVEMLVIVMVLLRFWGLFFGILFLLLLCCMWMPTLTTTIYVTSQSVHVHHEQRQYRTVPNRTEPHALQE